MTFFEENLQLITEGDRILAATRTQFPTLDENQIAITWLVYTGLPSIDPAHPSPHPPWGYHHRGDALIYPASVVKLFYLVAAYEGFAQGELQRSSELDRALQDMIVDSSNDATGLVMDMVTETTSGPELPPEAFALWQQRRNQVNDWIRTWGWPELAQVNMNQKTWCDGPYGRERAFLGPNLENRNYLTTDATARLVHSLVQGALVSVAACQEMLGFMARSLDPKDLAADPENQVTGFLGGGLPQVAKLWSKAGLTSKVRHDAAYIELPESDPCILVVFTEGSEHSQNEAILPFVAQEVVESLKTLKGRTNGRMKE
jgi:beta-lactamase class A